jgi:hypothetical protein
MSDTGFSPSPAQLGDAVGVYEVDRHRAVHCPEYHACLHAAVRKEWVGWPCQLCPLFATISAPRAADVLYGPVVLPA